MFQHLKEAKRFPEALSRFFVAEVILALEFLHSKDIIYRDISMCATFSHFGFLSQELVIAIFHLS
ncbi:Protein kinase domain protein [compost metagenome]